MTWASASLSPSAGSRLFRLPCPWHHEPVWVCRLLWEPCFIGLEGKPKRKKHLQSAVHVAFASLAYFYFTLFYPVLPCFTLFYPVLPCFTLFYPIDLKIARGRCAWLIACQHGTHQRVMFRRNWYKPPRSGARVACDPARPSHLTLPCCGARHIRPYPIYNYALGPSRYYPIGLGLSGFRCRVLGFGFRVSGFRFGPKLTLPCTIPRQVTFDPTPAEGHRRKIARIGRVKCDHSAPTPHVESVTTNLFAVERERTTNHTFVA